MGYTPKNYLTAVRALDQIATDAQAFDANVTRAVEQLNQAVTQLGAMASGWAPAIDFINQQALANSGDEEWQLLKRKADKLVVDFKQMLATAEAIRDAAQAAR